MNRFTRGVLAALLLDVALLAASFYHIPSLLDRPRAPLVLIERAGAVVIDQILDPAAAADLAVGDTVTSLAGQKVNGQGDVESLCDFRRIGERVPLTVQKGREILERNVFLIPFFSLRYVIIVLMVGIVTWGVGVFVLLARPAETAGKVLHAALICMGVATMMMRGSTPAGLLWPSINAVIYFVVYIGVAATFYFFTTLFPRPWLGSHVRRGFLVAAPAAVIMTVTCVYNLHALSTGLVDDFHTFRQLFHLFHLAILVYVGLGLWNFIRAYLTTESRVERRKLQWILFAFSVGPTPFLLLVVIPEFFMPVSPVPEEYALLFLMIIPVAFAISFVKYHLLDIEVVINRTTVYAIVLGTMLLVYTVLVGAVTYFVGMYTVESSAFAAVLIALGFEPARRRVQKFVDRSFFRVRYDFRQTERRFVESLKKAVSAEALGEMLVRQIDELIPLERIGFFVLGKQQDRVRMVAHRNFGVLEGRGVRFEKDRLRARLDLPVGLSPEIEPGVSHEEGDPVVFRRWGLALLVPMLSQEGALLGFLGLGRKKSSMRFSAEDIDLLVNVLTQAGLELERISLQQEVLREQAEALKQKTLNEMKTEFVRIVTHELKTPLTGIKLCAQLLRGRLRGPNAKAAWCVDTIEGEVDRLDRMVTTILTSARIERQAMEYNFADEDLGEITSSVLATMQYQLSKDRFTVVTTGLNGSRRYPLYADRDAVMEAIINLVANAIKYSAERKHLKIAIRRRGETVECAVQDRGIGIPSDALPHIFEKYYRDPSGAAVATGIGLGLPLVRHIMEAHKGSVGAASHQGKGSTFTLIFPVRNVAKAAAEKSPGH